MPEVDASAGPFEQMALVTVPEAAVNKDDGTTGRKDQIRFSWQATVMEAKPESARMKSSANCQFGPRVLSANTGHHSTARSAIDDVNQRLEASAEDKSAQRPLPALLMVPCVGLPSSQPGRPLRYRIACMPACPRPG